MRRLNRFSSKVCLRDGCSWRGTGCTCVDILGGGGTAGSVYGGGCDDSGS